ncbi:MAG: endolytic transglycosylase MltG [bacterium]|nr:endolytic transglycosylase MltG [bacterium]
MSHLLLKRKYVISLLLLYVALLIGTSMYYALWAAPKAFPTGSIVRVEQGTGLLELSERLEEDKVIRSSLWFRITAIVLRGERSMRAGEYYLPKRESVFGIARRVVLGDHRIRTVKLTIPEGFTVKKISSLFNDEFPYFDNTEFERLAPEGYLFPDTYFIPVTASASATIKLLRANFIRKVFPLMPLVDESDKSLEEIIIMASIIENEANTKESREIVSGILWKRLRQDMPLQVDASFSYVNGKSTKDLTLADLKIDSPYNTYLYPGLPPGPISNPGVDSILAALNPTTTPYLYFLTGDDGMMHYSETFDEHKEKKQEYIGS